MNVRRYLKTVGYLKPQQIYHQFKYRVFGYRYPKVKRIPNFTAINIFIPVLDEDDEYVARFKPEELLEDHIELLYESVNWESGKWGFDDKTHLWNFNLHYFEYGIALVARHIETMQDKDGGDERFLSKFKELYADWHDTCFAKHDGDAWHPYTISLRLKNLLIIGGMAGMENIQIDDLYVQYRFLIENQEKHLLGNHYFENLTTIYLCSIFFQEKDIQKKFEQKLIKEIREQILPDGMHYERSFMYHNLILEDLVRIWLVSDDQFKKYLAENIKKMTDCAYSFEEARLPSFNDCGSNIAKSRLQLIKAVEESLGYTPKKVKLKDAGYHKLENDDFSLIMDVGELAPSYISGHGQCDGLSIEMYYKGCPVLVNSGTYQYQTDKRPYFRGTISHSTLQAVHGDVAVEQSEVWGEHRTAGRIKDIKARCDDRNVIGRMKDHRGDELRRDVAIISDGVEIKDSCSVSHKNYWHIHPSNTVEQINDRKLKVIVSDGEILYITANKELRKFDSWYSEEFGRIDQGISYESKADIITISKR